MKCLAGRNEAFIIRWKSNIILFKKIFVHYKAMGICTHRKPVYAAILIFEIVKVGIIDSTCSIGLERSIRLSFRGLASWRENLQQVIISGNPPFSFRKR